MNLLKLQYEYLRRLRQRTLYRYYAKQLRIQEIKNYINAGGNIKNSDFYDDYLRLVDEYGENYFIIDDNNQQITITTEEQDI